MHKNKRVSDLLRTQMLRTALIVAAAGGIHGGAVELTVSSFKVRVDGQRWSIARSDAHG